LTLRHDSAEFASQSTSQKPKKPAGLRETTGKTGLQATMIALTIASSNEIFMKTTPQSHFSDPGTVPAERPSLAQAGAPRVVVMGITGSGKTEVSRRIAAEIKVAFIEGDAFHSPANRAKMQAGIALADEDRWAWLQTLVTQCNQRAQDSGGFVLACSALRRVYRDRLRQGLSAGLPPLRFVFLDAPSELVAARVAARADHFMPASLVASQVATLERPCADDEADCLHVSAAQALEAVVAQSISLLFPSQSSIKLPKEAA
jgi:gluconokinase